MFQSPFGDSMGITGCFQRLDSDYVSIPFRGFHGDNIVEKEAEAWGYEFQSPFGDSMGITAGGGSILVAETFQSPFGDSMGITIYRPRGAGIARVSIPFRGFHGDNRIHGAPRTGWGFQSPFGDSMGITQRHGTITMPWTCFNPLSGIPWG